MTSLHTDQPIHHDAVAPNTGGWTIADSAELYGLEQWGNGYFAANDKGHVVVRPERDESREIDLYEVVNGLAERGLHTPLLLRFTDLLRHRLTEIHRAFHKAIRDEQYSGSYCCVFPIKVNQQRTVVEEIRDIGNELGFGLEAGSKPELLAVLGMTADQPHMPIVCNGFKDSEFIEMIVLATKLGRNIIPVVEKFSELELIVRHAERYGVRPQIGVRAKISSPGSGRWEGSAGVRSKFGLSMSDLVRAVEYLHLHKMADCLNLLHFHLGSQICDIRHLKNAVTELAHIYTELRRLGAGMTTIDIGGGLGVDYDGSKSSAESSMNYSIDEYAADVIYRIKSICDDVGVPHPNIISESGRAMVAFSSVLVFDVVGSSTYDSASPPASIEEISPREEEELPQPVYDLFDAKARVEKATPLEIYHDIMQARSEILSLFSLGYVSLPVRAAAERLFWSIGGRILARAQAEDEWPEEFNELRTLLCDHYFCNMSVFQSMPDSWAIDQIFPICPIHRFAERPTRLGVLHDITCDSDGKIEHFVGNREIKTALELHALKNGDRYYLAAFLVGAYQEILGDLHNLFGDTHAVHVRLEDDGHLVMDEIVPGDTVAQSLSYVQIDPNELKRLFRRDTERAVRAGRLTPSESGALMRFYENGLAGYTYLEE